MSKKGRVWKAEELVERIRARYEEGRWVVVEQLADSTGAGRGSWVDVAAFGTWPSDGRIRAAFEVKVSRQDWLRELQLPSKNQWAREAFHEFWYVAPGDVIKEQELPEGCGWLKPRGDGLAFVRHAARHTPEAMGDGLLASALRSAEKEVERIRGRAREDVRESDSVFLKARAYQRAVEAFLQGRRVFNEGEDVKCVLAALEKASQSDADREDRERVLGALDRFQERMLGLVEIVDLLAFVGLMERDEAGEAVVRSWGGKDTQGLAHQRAMASRRDTTSHGVGPARDYMLAVRRLRARAKLMLRQEGGAGGE